MGCTQSTARVVANESASSEEAPSPPHSAISTRTAEIVDWSVDENGVVLYHVDAYGFTGKKRFNDFKAFHHDIQLVVPPMPDAGILTAIHRRNQALIHARRLRFQDILRAAPRDRVVLFLDPCATVAVGVSDTEKSHVVGPSHLTITTSA
ncbi:hypothetical protein H310_01327 [Aphanomyces invadans]|uniref:PX domain-containing protein n=1 Tax=Aphanomyces invadans TaxID=157072 RepID=A0A024URL2_9STRA|nr:hypothetical protein H310_01327 [Aphanomyces invadans]ETW08820.1 hypothetical protein H310_01327 [Aphanomyces invadans]|eukprot:XP_008862625.1 hypothetical protein H310_01327 [Aphanomyces invadans]